MKKWPTTLLLLIIGFSLGAGAMYLWGDAVSPTRADESALVTAATTTPYDSLVDRTAVDLDGDQVEETVELYVEEASIIDGRWGWNDGQHWLLRVRDGEREYPLFDDFVQFGVVNYQVIRPYPAASDSDDLPVILFRITGTLGDDTSLYGAHATEGGYEVRPVASGTELDHSGPLRSDWALDFTDSILGYLDDHVLIPQSNGKVLGAYRILGADEDRLYIQAYVAEFIMDPDTESIETGANCSGAMVLTLGPGEDSESISGHIIPKAIGDGFVPSIEELFPARLHDEIWGYSAYAHAEELREQAARRAAEWYGLGGEWSGGE